MSKVLTVMGLNWLSWRDLVAGMAVPGATWRPKQEEPVTQTITLFDGIFFIN